MVILVVFWVCRAYLLLVVWLCRHKRRIHCNIVCVIVGTLCPRQQRPQLLHLLQIIATRVIHCLPKQEKKVVDLAFETFMSIHPMTRYDYQSNYLRPHVKISLDNHVEKLFDSNVDSCSSMTPEPFVQSLVFLPLVK